uniref:Aspartokinase n=1 Tax=candidate division WOR-3 bacterium TaxID=2052148 RepID=A0A7C3NE29_UNCW3
MALIVKKFGGTSLATCDLIKHLAKRVASDIKAGNKVVVVVSAMGKTTNELISMAKSLTSTPDQREMDMLLTAGERISMALFSMALNSLDIKAYSFTGSQVGIITTSTHTDAKIITVKGERLLEALSNGITPIVAGFQGVSSTKEITTLGRGGSDTTAVAIAAFLKADLCEIYTDVDGVFRVDPRIVPESKIIDKIPYDQMLLMSHLGSKVLHPRSVEIAKKYNIPIVVKSSFNEGEGTMVTNIENIESTNVNSISVKDDLALVNMKIQDMGLVKLLNEINDKDLKIELFMTKSPENISLIISQDKVNELLSLVENFSNSLSISSDISLISFIGEGIAEDKNIIKNIIDIVSKYDKDVFGIFTNKISYTIVTKKAYKEKIVKEAGKRFELTK